MPSDAPSSAGLDPDAITRLHQAILAGIPNGRSLLTLRRIEALIDVIAKAMDESILIDEPAALDGMLNMLLISQRKLLNVPEDASSVTRLQQLAAGWQQNALAPDEKRLFERNVMAWNMRVKLQVAHPELARPHPPPDPATKSFSIP